MKILFAVDESEATEKAASYLLQAATPVDDILILGVVQIPEGSEDISEDDPLFVKHSAVTVTFNDKFKAQGLKTSTFVSSGPSVGEIICAVAEFRKVDLIVMGRRFHHGGHPVFGQESSYVLHNANCSVLVVKYHEASEFPSKRNIHLPKFLSGN
jgi:nucleotide-binding universal stress UspA family protein